MDAPALEKAAGSAAADGGEEQPVQPAPTAPAVPAFIDTKDADRYAMAFRPSWAPLEAEGRTSPAARTPARQRPAVQQDEPLRIPGRVSQRHAALVTVLALLSLSGLIYWGIARSTPDNPARVTTQAHIVTDHAPASDPALAQQPTEQTQASEPSRALTELAPIRGPRLSDAPPEELAPIEPAAEPAAAEAAAPPTEIAAVAAPEPPAQIAAAAAEPAAPTTVQAAPEVAQAALAVQTPAAAVAPAPQALATDKAAPAAAPQAARVTDHPAEAPVAVRAKAPLLVVRAYPEGTQLSLDGQRMANPFDVRLPRGGKHKIEARHDGYELSSQTVRIESDATLTISLRRANWSTPTVHAERPSAAHAQGAGFVTTNPY
ncbi:MAG: hypothetical protein RL701_7305 [Pseudomonadota bacterium]